MRPETHVQPVVALLVDGQFFIGSDAFANPLGLEFLAGLFEMLDRGLVIPHFAGDRQIALDDLAHLVLDGFKVHLGERRFACKVVIEAGVGRRTEGDLRAREQFLHRLRQHMRGVMADHFECLRLIAGDDGDAGVPINRARQVP